MNKKRSLPEELNITLQDDCKSPCAADVKKIKGLVNNKIASAYSERKFKIMKSKKKISVIAIAAVFALGVTAFAARGIVANWYSSSSSIPEYKSLPTAQQCMSDIGYSPKLIESFENGYEFKNGSVIDNNLTDENNNSVEKFKSVMFRYEKDGDIVNFSQEKFISDIKSIGEVAATVEGIDVYYNSYTNKFVPGDYTMTAEDEEAEKKGELIFSWGSPEIKIVEVQSAVWTEDGINYLLMQMDGELSAEELTDMAKEVISR